MLGAYLVALIVVWRGLDLGWTAVPKPLAHLGIVLADAGRALHPAQPVANAGAPWLWLADQVPVPCLSVGTRVQSGAQTVEVLRVAFRGMLNPFLVWAAPVVLGYCAILVRHADRSALLALVWAAVAVLPFVAIALAGRYTFLYYALPAVPALALAAARAAAAPGFPRPLVWVYAAAVLYGFAQAFPFVGFRCC